MTQGLFRGFGRWASGRGRTRRADRDARSSYDAGKYADSERIAALNRRRESALTILEGLAAAYGGNARVQAFAGQQRSRLSRPIDSTGFPEYRKVEGNKWWEDLLSGLSSAYDEKPPLGSPGTEDTDVGATSNNTYGPSTLLAPEGGLTRTPWVDAPDVGAAGASPTGSLSYEDILQAFDADEDPLDPRRRRRRTPPQENPLY